MQSIDSCDNTNSVKYIIMKNKCELLQTRKFSDIDKDEFLMYGSSEIINTMDKYTKNSILDRAHNKIHIINSNMLKLFFDEGHPVDKKYVDIFMENAKHDNLKIILEKRILTQYEIVDLLFRCYDLKCIKCLSSYLNTEGIALARQKVDGEKKFSNIITFIILFALALSVLLVKCGRLMFDGILGDLVVIAGHVICHIDVFVGTCYGIYEYINNSNISDIGKVLQYMQKE